MCSHDPTDSSDATHGDDPSPAWPPLSAAADTGSGESDPADVTLSAGLTEESAAKVGRPDTGMMHHIEAGLTGDLERSGPPPDSSYAVVIPTVPGYDLLEPLGEGGMSVVWKARQVKLNRKRSAEPSAPRMIRPSAYHVTTLRA